MKWVTRSHVHVDRVACPWLISRFVDSEAEFLFVPKSQIQRMVEETGAIPFDAPGVELGQVGKAMLAQVQANRALAKEGVGRAGGDRSVKAFVKLAHHLLLSPRSPIRGCSGRGGHESAAILVAQELHDLPADSSRAQNATRRIGPHAGQVEPGQPWHSLGNVVVRAVKLWRKDPGHVGALPVEWYCRRPAISRGCSNSLVAAIIRHHSVIAGIAGQCQPRASAPRTGVDRRRDCASGWSARSRRHSWRIFPSCRRGWSERRSASRQATMMAPSQSPDRS
jgi:hypothetical protein